MPNYEYECLRCGLHFERRQSMTDARLSECPECGGEVRRRSGSCSLEHDGRTCCGRSERCGKPPCEGGS